MQELLFTKVRDVHIPTRGTRTSSWLDFYVPMDITADDIKITPLNEPVKVDPKVYVTEDSIIIPGWRGVLIPSGLKVIMNPWTEDWTYDLVLIWKSGVSVKTNLIVWAAVIDNDYRGEFNIHLINPWLNDVVIKKWSKIVQGIIRHVDLMNVAEITNENYEKLSNTERGEGWFGSTGE